MHRKDRSILLTALIAAALYLASPAAAVEWSTLTCGDSCPQGSSLRELDSATLDGVPYFMYIYKEPDFGRSRLAVVKVESGRLKAVANSAALNRVYENGFGIYAASLSVSKHSLEAAIVRSSPTYGYQLASVGIAGSAANLDRPRYGPPVADNSLKDPALVTTSDGDESFIYRHFEGANPSRAFSYNWGCNPNPAACAESGSQAATPGANSAYHLAALASGENALLAWTSADPTGIDPQTKVKVCTLASGPCEGSGRVVSQADSLTADSPSLTGIGRTTYVAFRQLSSAGVGGIWVKKMTESGGWKSVGNPSWPASTPASSDSTLPDITGVNETPYITFLQKVTGLYQPRVFKLDSPDSSWSTVGLLSELRGTTSITQAPTITGADSASYVGFIDDDQLVVKRQNPPPAVAPEGPGEGDSAAPPVAEEEVPALEETPAPEGPISFNLTPELLPKIRSLRGHTRYRRGGRLAIVRRGVRVSGTASGGAPATEIQIRIRGKVRKRGPGTRVRRVKRLAAIKDGKFSSRIRLRAGRYRVEVRLTTTDGSTIKKNFGLVVRR